MTTESELSGVDLARQALLASGEEPRESGATRQKPKRRTTTAVRRDGREPLGLGGAIGMMMTERGMADPATGGSVLADFDTILTAVVPELAGRVKAVAFDAETGRLDVAPDLPAAGTQLLGPPAGASVITVTPVLLGDTAKGSSGQGTGRTLRPRPPPRIHSQPAKTLDGALPPPDRTTAAPRNCIPGRSVVRQEFGGPESSY
ncbi:DUF721 domain-containing protein [Streptomyces sp. NPDC051657]|uniref:DUF721 domain-containing protein n=1 Tax=unclassified Streptomyces TaxID=2593676 RepID=UPI003440903A